MPRPLPRCVDLVDTTSAVSRFSSDAVYQAAASGCTDDLRDILLLCDETTTQLMLEWSDCFDRTALIMATQEGHEDCILLLLKQGARVDQMCALRSGGTALHLAVSMNRSKTTIHQLLCHGADPFVVNSVGATPWDMSLSNRHPCHVMFASFALFEGLLCIWDPAPFAIGEASRSFWIRVIPRHERFSCSGPKRLTGLRLCIYRRALGDVVCELDLEGSDARIIPAEQRSLSHAIVSYEPSHVLFCDENIFGSLQEDGRSSLSLRGETQTLNALVNLITTTDIYPSERTDSIWEDDESERTSINSDHESNFDELSFSEQSSVSSSSLTARVHTDENLCPQGLGGSLLDVAHGRRTKARKAVAECEMAKVRDEQEINGHGRREGDVCVICLEKPRTSGFVHGESMHICACEDCAERVSKRSKRCPLCRKAIQHIVIKIY